LAYDFGLKGTPWSGIVFALAIPLIPLYAFAGMQHVSPLLYWLVPVAALLGIALNLANSLPDIEDDARQGARTLAVTLGLRISALACPLLTLLALLIIVLLALTHSVSLQAGLFWPFILVLFVLVLLQFIMSANIQNEQRRKPYFYLVVMTSLLLAAGWLIGALS